MTPKCTFCGHPAALHKPASRYGVWEVADEIALRPSGECPECVVCRPTGTPLPEGAKFVAFEPARDHDEAHRLNLLAGAVLEGRGTFVPLSVRYAAAQAADDVVTRWFASCPEPLTGAQVDAVLTILDAANLDSGTDDPAITPVDAAETAWPTVKWRTLLLDRQTRSMGFGGYSSCPMVSCPTPYRCSERGDCNQNPDRRGR